jgi:hypothetical protein
MVNYNLGKIYKIQQISGEGEICLGMTTKKYLSSRFDTLRSNYKLWKEGKEFNDTFAFEIFDLYGIDNCAIVSVDITSGITCKDELKARLMLWIQMRKCLNRGNSVPANKVPKCKDLIEYEEFKVKQKLEFEEYQLKHYGIKPKIPITKNVKKVDTIDNNDEDKIKCECGKILLRHNKSSHERTQYHIKRTKCSKPYKCECGKTIADTDRIYHEKTQFHCLHVKNNTEDKCDTYDCTCGRTLLHENKEKHEQSNYHKKYVNTVDV